MFTCNCTATYLFREAKELKDVLNLIELFTEYCLSSCALVALSHVGGASLLQVPVLMMLSTETVVCQQSSRAKTRKEVIENVEVPLFPGLRDDTGLFKKILGEMSSNNLTVFCEVQFEKLSKSR